MSPMLAIPTTTVKKMMGAIIIRISLMKASPRPQSAGAKAPGSEGLTHYVADFIVKTTYADIPAVVLEAGRRSILDGLGLAFSGSVAETGDRSRTYVSSLGLVPGKATVIGSSLKVTPRFAALLNGIAIHADDYDDTQLALAKDRV